VAHIARELEAIRLPFEIDERSTVTLSFFDGLCVSENRFMEAVYGSGKFPCLFVGGSAGGKFDFRNTYLFDNKRVVENSAVLCFLKMARGKRFGVFKSHAFTPEKLETMVVESDVVRRTVSAVLDPQTGEPANVLEVMARFLNCDVEDLPQHTATRAFAIENMGRLYLRSIAGVDVKAGEFSSYCDIGRGDKITLMRMGDAAGRAKIDFERFLRNKTPPAGAILFDCITRRLAKSANAARIDIFDRIPAAGFSTFGEMRGIRSHTHKR